jgi:hypothetical protein
MKNDVECESGKSAEMVRQAIFATKEDLTPLALKWASEFVDADEYELGLETIVDCLYEHGQSISAEKYEIIQKAARRLEIEDILTKVEVGSSWDNN